jgi:hypothetical protein
MEKTSISSVHGVTVRCTIIVQSECVGPSSDYELELAQEVTKF